MSNLFEIVGISGSRQDNLFSELDRAFYKKFPELWDNDESGFFIQGEPYISILNGETNSYPRQRKSGEEVTAQYIKRDSYHLWKVGRIYSVKPEGQLRTISLENQTEESGKISETYQIGVASIDVIGKIKLIEIKPGKQSWPFGKLPIDELIFEKVE